MLAYVCWMQCLERTFLEFAPRCSFIYRNLTKNELPLIASFQNVFQKELRSCFVNPSPLISFQ